MVNNDITYILLHRRTFLEKGRGHGQQEGINKHAYHKYLLPILSIIKVSGTEYTNLEPLSPTEDIPRAICYK